MRLKVLNKNINFWLLLFLMYMCGDVLPKNPYKSGEVRADYPKGCAYLKCNRGDQCVNRKFWCRNPPCPSMLYCSKSRKESLKGPSSCGAVRCSKGFICLVRVRHCRWGQSCEQQIARCVSERDYYDGPASCVGFQCPSGLGCILRESLCAKPPCKLVKSCANTKDVNRWYEGCKALGCLSEHECFLRKPSQDCRIHPCKHTPDCSAKSEEELEINEQCRGWVCPNEEECSAHTQGPCKLPTDGCRISRSCHRPLMVPLNGTSKHSWRDDVKLSFYSKLDKNVSMPGNYLTFPNLATYNKTPRSGITEDKKISTNSEIRNFYENPIHKAPIYVLPNSRSPLSRPSSVSPDIISGRVVQPTASSLSTWLNHLKQKTGVDAIEAWIKKTEKQENYGAFLEWLESVKDMLGSTAFDLWIEEVRTMTVTSPAFQKWLPLIPTNSPSVSPDFLEPERNIAKLNNQGLGIFPGSQKSIKYQNNEDNNYYQQRTMNGEVQDTGAMKFHDFNEESYIFPPKNDTAPIQLEITGKNAIPTVLSIPTSSSPIEINQLQQFYNSDPRVIQQAYPYQENVGNAVPWSNQALPIQRFDAGNPMNYKYQQYYQTPGIDPPLSNINTWQSQISPLMNSQRNQEYMDRGFQDTARTPLQQFQTNLSYQQPSNENLNFLHSKSWSDQFVLPVNPQRDQMTTDQRFHEPGIGSGQQYPTNWLFKQPLNRNFYFRRPNGWQGHSGSYLNPRQMQSSIGQRFLERENIPRQQFRTNWSFQQPFNSDSNNLRPTVWPKNLFPPSNPGWQQEIDNRDKFNRWILESAKLPGGMLRKLNKEPFDFYSHNFTNKDRWMKYFHDQKSRQHVPTSENFGTFPITGQHFGYESWPVSSYRGWRPEDVPHRRTKHEDSTRDDDHYRYDDKHIGKSGETSHELVEDPGLAPVFSWLIDRRLQDLYLWNQYRKHFYNKNNREGPPALSSVSRTRRVNADTRSPSPKPFFENSLRDAPRLTYHWPNTYLYDQLYGMTKPQPSPSSITLENPIFGIRKYDERLDPFPKLERPEEDEDGKLGFIFNHREFDVPRQPMGTPDLWNPMFKTPLSFVLRKLYTEGRDHRDIAEKETPISTTISPPVVPSSKSVAPQQVVPVAKEESYTVKDNDYQEGIKDIENYDDDGIYPLLLSLQGYIETSEEEEPENPAIIFKNSTILPVYSVEDAIDGEEENLRSSSDDKAVNFFKNVKYGGSPDFPKNLKSIFDVEAAMIMKNTTGQSDVRIKDIKWEYDDNEEDTLAEDPSSFFVLPQDTLTSTHGLLNIEVDRDWTGSKSSSSNEGDTENNYYDDGVDYEESIPEDESNYNFQQVNTGDLLDYEEVPEDLIDSFSNDPDHRRFKKNRP